MTQQLVICIHVYTHFILYPIQSIHYVHTHTRMLLFPLFFFSFVLLDYKYTILYICTSFFFHVDGVGRRERDKSPRRKENPMLLMGCHSVIYTHTHAEPSRPWIMDVHASYGT